MEHKRVKIVIIVVSALGLLSAATGFAAEATKIKPSQIASTSSERCVYPKSPAFPLGLTAALALAAAQIIIFCEDGCVVRGRGPCLPGSLYNATFSLVTFIAAFLLLLIAAAVNDYGHNMSIAVISAYDYYKCYYTRRGVFTVGTLLSLASISSSLAHYLYVNSARNAVQHGIVMAAKAQLPQAQVPVSRA